MRSQARCRIKATKRRNASWQGRPARERRYSVALAGLRRAQSSRTPDNQQTTANRISARKVLRSSFFHQSSDRMSRSTATHGRGRPCHVESTRPLPAHSAVYLPASWSLLLASPARATKVELRLVPYDQPDATVKDREKTRPLTNPVSTPQGMVMKQVGVETVALARGHVMLDGKPVFGTISRREIHRPARRLPMPN